MESLMEAVVLCTSIPINVAPVTVTPWSTGVPPFYEYAIDRRAANRHVFKDHIGGCRDNPVAARRNIGVDLDVEVADLDPARCSDRQAVGNIRLDKGAIAVDGDGFEDSEDSIVNQIDRLDEIAWICFVMGVLERAAGSRDLPAPAKIGARAGYVVGDSQGRRGGE
jgi:hypothetical protein